MRTAIPRKENSRFRNLAEFLIQIEIWPVVLILSASLIKPQLLFAAVLTAAFFWPLRWIASPASSARRFSIRTPGDYAMLLLVLMALVSLWATSLPEKTNPQVLRLLSGIGLYYALVNWTNTPKRLRLILSGLVLAGLGLALLAPFGVEWPVSKLPFIPAALYQRFSLWLADTIHPNVIAGNLALILPIAMGWLLFAWRKMSWFERVLCGIAVPLMLAVIGLTQSRGAWMATGAALTLLLILRWRWGWIGLALIGIASAILINSFGWFVSPGFRPILEKVASSNTIGGIDGRLEIWSRAVYMIQDFPFTGVGMGSFMEVADAMYPFFRYTPESIHHAHNLFLQVAVDLGIPGLVAWLVLLLTILALALQLYRFGGVKTESGFTRDKIASGLGAGVICSQVALIVHGMTDAVTWGMVRPAPLVFGIWGVTVAGWFIFRRARLAIP